MKKKPEVEKDNSERWMLTYLDMITLLFVTFVVLYAISVADKAKFQSLSESLSIAFGVESVTATGPGAGAGQGKVITSKTQKTPVIPKQSKTAKSMAYDNVYSFLKSEINTGNVRVTQEQRGILIQLGGKFFFKAGSAELPDADYDSLIVLAQALTIIPNEIQIEGYADPIEVTTDGSSKFSSSWDLAAKRAVNILEFFQEQDVPAEKMHATSYGSTHLVAKEDTAEGRAYNRHIEILLLYEPELPPEPQSLSEIVGEPSSGGEAKAPAEGGEKKAHGE